VDGKKIGKIYNPLPHFSMEFEILLNSRSARITAQITLEAISSLWYVTLDNNTPIETNLDMVFERL